MKYILLLLVGVLIFACEAKSNKEIEIEAIPVYVDVVRFDKAFANAKVENLAQLKAQYPVFFPKQFHDSIWIQKIQDTLQQELNTEVSRKFPTDEFIEDPLHSLFQHIKYYFPNFRSPVVVTTTSDVDYQNKVIVTDTMLVVALDNYLGSEHTFYQGIKAYVVQNLKPSQLAPDVASAYAKQLISRPTDRSLLGQMVYYGKELYLKDLWLPGASDAEKIGYSDEQMQWVLDNETEIWRYFIENELLFSTNAKLSSRFINPAPFSKFYLEIDNESPGMVGRYLGWQIVKAYMDKNSVGVQQLLSDDADKIFKESNYKPQKK